MKKQNLLRLIEALLFCVLLLGVLGGVSEIMERKMSNIRFKPFYQKAQQHDVVFIGDSHMVNGVFPMELWKEYGITSYNLSSYGNTLPVSYWTLMNALDYASPKLAVIGIKDVEKDRKLTSSSSDVHTALDAYPLTLTKIRAIEELMDDPDIMDDAGNRYTDMKWEYYFTLGKYHDRWSELSWNDIEYELNCQKGGDMLVAVAEPDDYELIDYDRVADEIGAGYLYLRRIIEECKNRGMDVLLTHLPYPSDADDQMAANTVALIAEEYGIGFIDFVSLDQVVDYHTDCYDADSHLNASGAQKVTDYLGHYIRSRYEIPDRRSDEMYAAWNDDYDEFLRYKEERLREQRNLHDVLMLLHDSSYRIDLAIDAQAEVYWDDQALTLMHNAARERVHEDSEDTWSDCMFPLEGLEEALADDEAYFLQLDCAGGNAEEFVGSDARARAERIFGEAVWEDGKEIRLRVMDRAGDRIIASYQF